jgi:hypothetical protein
MVAPQVGIVGVKALLKDLAAFGADTGPLAKALSQAGKTAVAPVAALTRSELPKVNDTLANDVRTSGTRTGATVRMGRASVNWAGWVEFGGTRPQGPSDRSARPFRKGGRYLFPAANRLQSTVADLYSKGAQDALDAYPWTNSSTDGGSVHD